MSTSRDRDRDEYHSYHSYLGSIAKGNRLMVVALSGTGNGGKYSSGKQASGKVRREAIVGERSSGTFMGSFEPGVRT